MEPLVRLFRPWALRSRPLSVRRSGDYLFLRYALA